MMRQRWGLGTVLGVSGIAAALIAACSGNDIPPISNDDRDAFEDVYGDDVVGAAGASMTAAGAGGGGMVGRGGSGGGGAPPVGGNGGGSGSGSGPVGGGTPCNAPVQVFAARCADAGCHGEGSALGDFAASEAAAMEFIDVPGSFGTECGLWIDSSNPEESAILTKTLNPVAPGCGQRMPLSGDFLNAEEEACVTSWLSQFGD